MLTVYIIALGKLKDSWMREGLGEYEKRLQSFCQLQIIQVPEVRLPNNPSPEEIAQALEKEAALILEKIPERSKVIPLCIEGKMISSEKLAELFLDYSLETSQIVFVIGSSHGLSDTIKKKGNFRLSLSPMTFPHQLARVLLCEQVYRSLSINGGGKYHK